MKRLITFMLVITMTLAFSVCGGTSETLPLPSGSPSPYTAAYQEPADEISP